MNFLKLREGWLILNPAQIATVEKGSDTLLVLMGNGMQYILADADMQTVLDAVTSKPAGFELQELRVVDGEADTPVPAASEGHQ